MYTMKVASVYASIYNRHHKRCASGSVVEYRLAKARVAGSNPVSRLFNRKLSIESFLFFDGSKISKAIIVT